MGVHFHGYSNVRSEPLPTRFRRVRKARSEAERQAMGEKLRSYAPDVQLVLRAISGADDDEYTRNEAAEDEFWCTIGEEKNFLQGCWFTNTVWHSTDETEDAGAGCSYGAYSDFVHSVRRASLGQPVYLPPDTDLTDRHGVWTAADCARSLKDLDRVRAVFVPATWKPFDDDDDANDIHNFSHFFREFYQAMLRGAESGVLFVR